MNIADDLVSTGKIPISVYTYILKSKHNKKTPPYYLPKQSVTLPLKNAELYAHVYT